MCQSRGIVQFITIVLILAQPIFSEIIRFDDGGITYEYDNSSKPLGVGGFGTVFAGIRTEGNHSESVAFKELRGFQSEDDILIEKNVCETMGQHDAFPTFYRYFPQTNETKAIFVMERIGRTLSSLWHEFRPFSPITAMQIGLQVLDGLEWMHGIGFTHNDLHSSNIAVGYHNKSKIYLFDFSLSEMNKNRTTLDLESVSHALKRMIRSNYYDKIIYESNSVLNEFEKIADNYESRSISDDEFRNKTFGKLRNILMAELESHKMDIDYNKCDIGYIQDAVDGMNLLRKLIKKNDTLVIGSLIQTDKELNINAGFGNSSYYKPIHLAAELGNARVVQSLIELGSEINFKYNDTHSTMSPIHYAAIKGHVDVVDVLCENGAEINATLLDGKTSLHWAAENGKVEVVRTLCKRSADINITDNLGRSPLHFAAMNGSVDLAQFLLQHDAELNAECSDGSTPLYYASLYRRVNLSIFLIENGAEVNNKNVSLPSPLHYAAMCGHFGLIQLLIEHGAEINVKCPDGKTPLHYLAAHGQVNAIRFLIKRGADFEARDNDGMTPLHIAAKSGDVETVRFLYEIGADINAKCFEGKTLLHYAVGPCIQIYS